MIVAHEAVVEEVDPLGQAGGLEVLPGVHAAHHADGRLRVVRDQVALDAEDPRRRRLIVDQLDSVSAVARDPVVPDHDGQLGAAVVVKSHLDPIVAVVPYLTALDHDRYVLVQIDPVVPVVLEGAISDQAPRAALVVDAVTAGRDAVVGELEPARGAHAVARVADGEAPDRRPGTDRAGDLDGVFSTSPVDHGLVDEGGVAAGEVLGGEDDRLPGDDDALGVDSRRHQHHVSLAGRVDRLLDRRVGSRGPRGTREPAPV